MILAVRGAKGPKHDYKIFLESGIKLPATTCLKVEQGFQGIQLQYPKAQVPYKATKLPAIPGQAIKLVNYDN